MCKLPFTLDLKWITKSTHQLFLFFLHGAYNLRRLSQVSSSQECSMHNLISEHSEENTKLYGVYPWSQIRRKLIILWCTPMKVCQCPQEREYFEIMRHLIKYPFRPFRNHSMTSDWLENRFNLVCFKSNRCLRWRRYTRSCNSTLAVKTYISEIYLKSISFVRIQIRRNYRFLEAMGKWVW